MASCVNVTCQLAGEANSRLHPRPTDAEFRGPGSAFVPALRVILKFESQGFQETGHRDQVLPIVERTRALWALSFTFLLEDGPDAVLCDVSSTVSLKANVCLSLEGNPGDIGQVCPAGRRLRGTASWAPSQASPPGCTVSGTPGTYTHLSV